MMQQAHDQCVHDEFALRQARSMIVRIAAVALVVGCVPTRPPSEAEPTPNGVASVSAPPAAALERVALPAMEGAQAPRIVSTSAGLVASWLEPAGDGHRLRVATLTEAAVSTASTVVEGRPVFVNWADVPSVREGGDGALYTWWPEIVGNAPYAYGVQLARSVDGGTTWSPLGMVHDDGTATEHGFVSMAPVATGVRVAWLDGRETGSGEPMTLRTAVVGAEVGATSVLDARVCDCCGTDATSVADGATLIVARDRSVHEIRDIVAVRVGVDGVATTARVHADGWEIAGCPVNGPRVVARGDRVAVAWYTEVDGPEVRLAWSDDGGRTFGDVVPIAGGAADGPLGRVGLAWAGREDVAVSWLDRDTERAVVRVRRASRDGRVGEPLDLGFTGADRASGFPALARYDDWLGVVWTVPEVGLEARRVPLAALPPVTARPTPDDAIPTASPSTIPLADYRPDRLDGGGEVDFAGLAGRPVLVNLWATWCAPCMAELPELLALHRTWSPRGLEVVSVAIDDNAARARIVTAKRGMTWTHAVDGSARAARVFGTDQLPTTILYAPDGAVLWSKRGALDADESGLDAVLRRVTGTGGR